MKRILFLLALVVLTVGTVRAQERDSIRVGDVYRGFYLHLPAGYAQSTGLHPLVLGMHGANQDPVEGAISFSAITRLNSKADSEGFIVVYPEGTGVRGGERGLTWNGGGCCAPASARNIDDVGFIRALLDTLGRRYRVDAARTYATGISNGGIMCYRLACELPNRIAAIAPVEAAYMVTSPCAPTRGVPALHIHSLQDSAIPYNGGTGVLSPTFPFPSVDSTISVWRRAIGCAGGPETIATSPTLLARRWGDCDDAAVVELYATSDGGHSWPGAPGGHASMALDATDVIWEFFSRYSIHISGSVPVAADAATPTLIIVPNPASANADARVTLARRGHVEVELFDLDGRLVVSLLDAELDAGEHAVRLPRLAPGVYLARARVDGVESAARYVQR